jgi:hypothetical protein
MSTSLALNAALSAMENGGMLTGIPVLWRACVGGIGLVASTARRRSEFQIAAIHLELEKLRLYKWGEKIGLIRSGEASGQRAIYLKGTTSLLRHIENLIKSANALQKKYFPRHNTSQYDSEMARQSFASPNNPLQLVFEDLYSDINQLAKDDQPPIRRKTVWATADETKFSELINQIRDYIDRLWALHRLDKERFDNKLCEAISSSTAIQVLDLLKDTIDGRIAKAASERLDSVSDPHSPSSTITLLPEMSEGTTTVKTNFQWKSYAESYKGKTENLSR